jgi:MscS family membrane protein
MNLSDFLAQTFYNNTIENWFYSFFFLLGGILLSKAIYWVFKSIIRQVTAKTKTQLDDVLVDVLEKPVVYALIIGGAWLGFERLHFTEGVDKFVTHAFTFVIIFNITWLLTRVVDALIGEFIVPLAEKTETNFDDQIIPILRKGVKGVLWTVGVIVGLDNAGFDIMALIAGLGIGGLALALAAQDTVKNIFGGVMVFIDKPFKLGDRVVINGHDGFVSEVGIRSTRLRTLEGRQITVPNSRFAESSIENISAEPARRVSINLGLIYSTTPEKMELAMKILEEIAVKNQEDITEEYLISFNNWGNFSLGILFIYHIRKSADILKTQSKVNLQILKQFNENNLEFAFPTQTIYTKEMTQTNVTC